MEWDGLLCFEVLSCWDLKGVCGCVMRGIGEVWEICALLYEIGNGIGIGVNEGGVDEDGLVVMDDE